MTQTEPDFDLGHVRDLLASGGYAAQCGDGAPWPDAARWLPMEVPVLAGPPRLRYADASDVDGRPYGTDPDQVDQVEDSVAAYYDYVEELYVQSGVLQRRRRETCAARMAAPWAVGRLARMPLEPRLAHISVLELSRAMSAILEGPLGPRVSDRELNGLLVMMFADGRGTWRDVQGWTEGLLATALVIGPADLPPPPITPSRLAWALSTSRSALCSFW